MRGSLRACAALAVLAWPAFAAACPVCQDPRDANQAAFLGMTVFMSLLPLGLIGGVVVFLWRSSLPTVDLDATRVTGAPHESGVPSTGEGRSSDGSPSPSLRAEATAPLHR